MKYSSYHLIYVKAQSLIFMNYNNASAILQDTTLLKSFLFFLVATFLITVTSLIEFVSSIIIIFFLLSTIFLLFLKLITPQKYQKEIFYLFYLALVINVSAMILMSYLFKFNIGVLSGANDELSFYLEGNIADLVGLNLENYISKRPYPLYLWLLTTITTISNFFGGNSPINFKILSVFIGSCLPIVVFLHIRRNNTTEEALKVALFTILFPTFIYFSAIGVRDILIIVLTALFFYFLIDKGNILKKLILVPFIIVVTFLLRIEHAAFLAVIGLFYLFLANVKMTNFLKIAFLILFSCSAIGGTILFRNKIVEFTQEQIVKQQEIYMEIFLNAVMEKNALQSSLTLKLKTLPVPLNYLSMYGYVLIGNFPPQLYFDSPFLRRIEMGRIKNYSMQGKKAQLPFSPGRIFKVLGPLVWYFIFPFILLGFFFKKKYLNFDFRDKYIIFMGFLYIFLISIFTTDIGRLAPMYAVMYPFGLLVRQKIPKNSKQKINIGIVIFIIILMIVYYAIKSSQ